MFNERYDERRRLGRVGARIECSAGLRAPELPGQFRERTAQWMLHLAPSPSAPSPGWSQRLSPSGRRTRRQLCSRFIARPMRCMMSVWSCMATRCTERERRGGRRKATRFPLTLFARFALDRPISVVVASSSPVRAASNKCGRSQRHQRLRSLPDFCAFAVVFASHWVHGLDRCTRPRLVH